MPPPLSPLCLPFFPPGQLLLTTSPTPPPRQPPKCRTFPYLNLSVRPHSFAFRLVELEPAINHIQRAQTSLHPISPVPPGTAEQCHTHPFSLESLKSTEVASIIAYFLLFSTEE
ncbi:uncharacterized protein BO66DRAFT_426943 [Aspergillus aculeatinus CBS 121060]|uniref:Uncharacterized protein n=1 Tax=Aspergillus aculeatinus CBS 121060 TaxID=1448322 RepID=A0ACD1HHC8_9EURO|nr:hypothetical protein BO66DRAFT_426943 [Aspergillus aculeatinus CBS 121060]RAH72777.1 hypothetical protein BO66DRAFT_426943 [Aspergillus aculeatinus CBS 121060]